MDNSLRKTQKKVELENRKRKNIIRVNEKWKIKNYLEDNISSDSNFLINGKTEQREKVLYHWIRQLYGDEEISGRPIVVISTDDTMAKEMYLDLKEGTLPFSRVFVMVDKENPEYDVLLGMSAMQAVNAVRNIALWKKKEINDIEILESVCRILERYQYEVSLSNLHKIYECGRVQVANLLENAGYIHAAQLCRGEVSFFQNVRDVLNFMDYSYMSISDLNNTGCSLLEMVKENIANATSMPFFYFTLHDLIRADFMEYLAIELKEVSFYCRPILVIDSIQINQQANNVSMFCDYILNAKNISLTIAAADCSAIFPEHEIENILGRYEFIMFLLKSSHTVEKLTRPNIGSYEHLVVKPNVEKSKKFLHFFPDSLNDGWVNDKEERLRIRGMDVDILGDTGCYVQMEHQIYEYTKMIFN